MSTPMRKRAFAAGIAGIVVAATSGCMRNEVGYGSPFAASIGNTACPELRSGAMSTTFDEDARANATIRAYVTASGDLADTAAKVEADVFTACERMADDLDIDDDARRPKFERGSKIAASCNAVAARIDAILQRGANARVRADVTAPQCDANGSTEASCRAQCNGAAGAPADARCESSCKAHAALTAECTEPRVNVQANAHENANEIGKVAATLEQNLAPLVTARIAYGERIAGDVDALVRTGAELPRAFGSLPAKAGSCVAAAANASVAARASLRVSVQASATVVARAGAPTTSP